MRISDWSSDVCSSDLPFARPRRSIWLAIFRLTRALPFLQALHWRAAPTFPFACVSHHRSDRARYVVLDRSSAGRHDEDRKSVGSGQRGYVRVDLGGRRISKKKKNQLL